MAAPYYANYSTEVIFHCATLVPTDDWQTKKSLISRNSVLILWIEDDLETNYYGHWDGIFKSSEVHIVIHPLQCGLYQVLVRHNGKKVTKLGLFVNGCRIIVLDHCVGLCSWGRQI